MRKIYSYLLSGMFGLVSVTTAMAQTIDADSVTAWEAVQTKMQNNNGYVLGYANDKVTAVEEAFAAYKANPTDDNKAAVTNAINNAESNKVDFVTGKYYRIIVGATEMAQYGYNRSMHEGDVTQAQALAGAWTDNNRYWWSITDSTSTRFIFRIDGDFTNGVKIYSPHMSSYYVDYSSQTKEESSATTLSVTTGIDANYPAILNFPYSSGAKKLQAFGIWGGSTDKTGETPVYIWNRPGADARMHRFFLKEVTTIYKSITASENGAYYATAYYPFAVTIPTNVTAYAAASENNTHIILAEVTGGIIPANTGVILEATATGTYAFGITYDAGTSPSANLLSGVSAKTDLDAGNYVFQQGDNGIGFYKTDASGTLGAGKAYITSANITTASFHGLDFNKITAISNATTAADDATDTVYYDLQGRRVIQPRSGSIYVTASGKKVLVK